MTPQPWLQLEKPRFVAEGSFGLDLLGILGASLLERVPHAIVLTLVAAFFGWLPFRWAEPLGTFGEAIRAAALGIGEREVDRGAATLLAVLVTIGVGLVGYFWRLKTRRMHASRALLQEIRTKHEGNRKSAQGLEGILRLVVQWPPVRPIVTVDDPREPVFDGQQEALVLLPSAVSAAIIDFYQNDAFLSAILTGLKEQAFHDASTTRRAAYVQSLARFHHEQYRPSARRAMRRLRIYSFIETAWPL